MGGPKSERHKVPAADTATTRLGLDMDRISFTILLQTAGDLVTTASNILPTGPADLAGLRTPLSTQGLRTGSGSQGKA